MLHLERMKWGRIALAWLLFALFMMGLVYGQAVSRGAAVHWRTVVLSPLLHSLLWALLTPVVFALASRFDLTAGRRGLLVKLLVHVAAGVALTVGYRAVYVLVLRLLAVPGTEVSWAAIVSSLNVWVPMYWMLLLAAYALEYSDRYRHRSLEAARLETQLVQAQLQALKMQLKPHFLFNALNAIAALTGDDPKAGQRMMGKLGQFLRVVLDHSDAQQVTLEQELQFTALYLEIEQIRFSDRLTLCYEVDPETRPALVPSLLLQPLVENAVRHGIARNPDGGTVCLRATRQGERLQLGVYDDGPGAPGFDGAWGIGLRNTEDRLRALHGAGASLRIDTGAGQGFTVWLDLPFITTA
ncbi:sensor histidine kinase [Hymenobacter edaphi]|uniref:Signlal transduction histidine kinase, LytS n=1 Tax=Hymenobacter edaphi TaxID=2211146 RepID=A0A328B5D8_9BACT|nr:histidine kinase [Hymenobacter edaphi]RAK62363.1 signlal transduction histidine kinase, LytS [Hymenobacter edaphi]